MSAYSEDKDFQKFRVTEVKPIVNRKGRLYGWQVFFTPITGHRLKAILDVFKKKPGTPAPRKGHIGRSYFRGAARGRDGCEEYGRGVVINEHVYFYQTPEAVRQMQRRNFKKDLQKLRQWGDERPTEKIMQEFQKSLYP